jgi:hypothetical protein
MYSSSLKEEKIELNNKPVLRIVDSIDTNKRKDYFLYYNSGVFPIFMVIIFFLCMGVIVNIGLRIQNLNYDKKIYTISQLTASEEERFDRLSLKISELKSPSRIASNLFSYNDPNNLENEGGDKTSALTDKSETGQAVLGEKKSENYINFKNLDIFYSKTLSESLVSDQETVVNKVVDNNYKGVNLISITKNIKDVLMVVSEGILTFFIP